MVDTRFYEALGPLRLDQLAERAQARLAHPEDAGVEIAGVGALDARASGLIGFLESSKARARLDASTLSACIVRESDAAALADAGPALVIAKQPQAAFARACAALIRPRDDDFGPHDGVHPSAEIGEGAMVVPGARIAQDAIIGPRVRIGANAVVGCGVQIGESTEIAPGAVVRFARIGARAHIGPNAAIGQPGFGLAEADGGLIDLPHVGRVLIGDDVSIGACTTIDRGMLADTEIGDGSKIDNLVQIAHNVRIGRSCVLAGCCGISGSAVIEDGAMLGGSVGVSDHVTIGKGARVAGGSALVMRDVPTGETWAGAPARPFRRFFREMAALERLARRSGGNGESQ